MNKRQRDDALDLFFDAYLSGDVGGAVERQEARGQRELNASEMLPKRGTIEREGGHYGPVWREKLEALGFIFGDEGDDLFVHCTLPGGWTKKATDHSMWSKLYDEQGRERASIFYKAAYYDRDAHMSWIPRYRAMQWYGATPDEPENWSDPNRENKMICYVVKDGETVIWHGEPVRNYDWHANDAAREESREWLREHYPQWDDAFAYWQ